MEPQIDTTAYIHSVQAETEGLPALIYITGKTNNIHSFKNLFGKLLAFSSRTVFSDPNSCSITSPFVKPLQILFRSFSRRVGYSITY